MLKRKALLDRLVGGIKHYSNYMDVVRENTPRGIQLTELNIGDEELKVDGAAVDFSAVGNLSVSLGTSPAISDSNIEYASRPEKQPGIVAFSLKAKLTKTKPASEQSKPPATPINTALINSEVTRNE